MNRYDADINGYFLCDRGRFGIGFVNGEQRIKQVKGIAQQSPLALSKLDVAKALSHFRKKSFIGIGSARASLEANFYLKNIVGAEHFSPGYLDDEMKTAAQHAQLLASNAAPSLTEIEGSDFIFVIGEDITQTAPRMALSVRQALRNAANAKAAKIGIPSWQDSAVRTAGGKLLSPLFLLQSTTTKLDDVAEQTLLLSVAEISNCLATLVKLIKSCVIENASDVKQQLTDLAQQGQLSSVEQKFIFSVYQGLHKAKQPLIISGTSLVCAEMLSQIDSLMQVFKQQNKMKPPALIIIPPSSNSVGLLSILDEKSLSIEQVLSQLAEQNNRYQGVILLEQALEKLSENQVRQLRDSSKTLIVLDHTQHRLSMLADIVLPVAAVSEGDGHYVNYQGRAQQFFQVHAPVLPIQESWRWLDIIADIIGIKPVSAASENQTLHTNIVAIKKSSCESLMQVQQFFSDHFAQWPNLIKAKSINPDDKAIARMPHRASGRTAQMANISVHEAKTTQKIDDDYTFSMEGQSVNKSADMPFTWAPGWNSNQSIGQFQRQINGELIAQKSALFISISSAITNNLCWQLTEADSRNVKDSQSLSSLTYVQLESIYFSEWQATQTPEFQMLRSSNQLSINTETAEKFGVKKGQWCKVVFSATNDKKQLTSQSVISQIRIVNHLPSTLAFGNFSLCQSLNHQLEMTISLACDQEVTDYLALYNERLIAAKNSKNKVLERLKLNDQTIPIRLMSGGLDDG
tara:strand:+ start:17 stop:2248 length:2232 start_codon:yes stop_codon:yes gene_type:complete